MEARLNAGLQAAPLRFRQLRGVERLARPDAEYGELRRDRFLAGDDVVFRQRLVQQDKVAAVIGSFISEVALT